MGTQGSITVYDEDGKDIANIVTQYDGYDLHEWVERFVSGKQLTNGISNDYDFNGMGDLAARLIAALKNQRYKGDIGQPVKPGNVYLYDTPYETDYHITLVYQGEGKKPKMTVSTPEWTDNYYDNTMLPSLGEANVRMQGAETFNADSTPRFIPVEVIKYDAWWTRRYGREYNPTLFGNDYDDSYAVCVRDIPIAHFDTKEKAENHANTVSTAISVLGGVTPSTIDHPLALREMDGYADKNIRGGMNMAETFNADYSLYDRKAKQKVGVKSGYDDYKDAYDDWENEIIKEYPNRVSENEWIVIDTHSAETFEAEQCKHEEYYVIGMDGDEWNDGGENFAMLEIECESCGVRGKGETNLSYDTAPNREHNSIWWEDIGFEAETFNAYKVAPALSSYSKDELISSKAGPQGSASYDEMVYDPIAQDRLSAESFASETSSTLKSMGYVAGTIGVGYLIFQRFVKDRLDETMNQ